MILKQKKPDKKEKDKKSKEDKKEKIKGKDDKAPPKLGGGLKGLSLGGKKDDPKTKKPFAKLGAKKGLGGLKGKLKRGLFKAKMAGNAAAQMKKVSKN